MVGKGGRPAVAPGVSAGGATLIVSVGATTGPSERGDGVAADAHPSNPAASSSKAIRESGLKAMGNIGGQLTTAGKGGQSAGLIPLQQFNPHIVRGADKGHPDAGPDGAGFGGFLPRYDQLAPMYPGFVLLAGVFELLRRLFSGNPS